MLYYMRLVNTFIIAMYAVQNYLLLIPNLVEFCAELIEYKNEFHFALEVSFSILCSVSYWQSFFLQIFQDLQHE